MRFLMVAVMGLSGRLACAQSVQVRGPADVDSPRAFGSITVRVSLFDAETGGRLLWRSPPFFSWAKSWRWRFAGVRGPADEEALGALPRVVFAEFESGSTVFKPRQAFHRSPASTDAEAVFDPGEPPAEESEAAAPPPRRAARREAPPEEGGITVGEGPVVLARKSEPAPPAPPPPARVAAPRPADPIAPASAGTAGLRPASEPSLADLRLSNDLYFQALREYRMGNAKLALAKLQVALRLNPANAEARVAEERIGQETDAPRAPSGAAPSPEAVRQAQDLYFAALRHYGKGQLARAETSLARAAQTDPTDRGIATALLRLRREMVLAPDVVH